ncbi:MAG: MucB/RseB C-terminal domain-containing protein [Pseudomonadota bacterium]
MTAARYATATLNGKQVETLLNASSQSRNRRRRTLAGQATLAAAAFTVAASANAQQCAQMDSQVRDLLRAMSSNAQQIDYRGVVTLQRGGDMQIMELTHTVTGGKATEAISRLTGQDARIERQAHPNDCMHPGHHLLRAEQGNGGTLCSLVDNYQFRVSSGDRIAGREAIRVRVEPRDMYRFGYVFELDRDTALMLKSTTYSIDQQVLEQFQFASLSMERGKETQAELQHQASHPHPHETRHLREGPEWAVSWLPKGYVTTDAAPLSSERKSYTDGLSSFSVFLEPLQSAIKPGEGVERQGSTVAYTRGTLIGRRPVLVTVVGEIPTNTARMVADSVKMR